MSTDDTIVLPEIKDSPSETIYDPSKDREKMRGGLAWSLLFLIAGVVIGSFIAMIYGIEMNSIRDWLTIVFGSLTTLFGAITGFYFGEKSGR